MPAWLDDIIGEFKKDFFYDCLGGQPDARLNRLFNQLKDNKFPYQVAPYPADHGERHIKHVLKNLIYLLHPYGTDTISIELRTMLLAAGMIHDIAMIPMRSTGADGPKANAIRGLHAFINKIKGLAISDLTSSNFTRLEAYEIIAIAAAHADDPIGGTAVDKLAELEKYSKQKGDHSLWLCALLLQAADFFDMGVDRLTDDVKIQHWSNQQIEHYKKHSTVNAKIEPINHHIYIFLSPMQLLKEEEGKLGVSKAERVLILDKVFHEATTQVQRLNNAFNLRNLRWAVRVDEESFGTRLPIGADSRPFKTAFNDALSRWEKDHPKQPFPVDMMGHSLYGRFVKNVEELNGDLFAALHSPGMHLRILILDPNIENQQMCEVYDGQKASSRENGRSILPRYGIDGGLKVDSRNPDAGGSKSVSCDDSSNPDAKCDEGDILETIRNIRDEWLPEIKGRSFLELRTTARIMYACISRYGDSIIVTPYRLRGLFRESQSWLYTKESPFYQEYMAVFNHIWNREPRSTLLAVKVGKEVKDYNPVEGIFPNRESETGQDIIPSALTEAACTTKRETKTGQDIDPLDYEQFMLREHLPRIEAIFDRLKKRSKKVIPPFEVEIQPSEECSLNCAHCIGEHLGRRHNPPAILKSNLQSLLNFKGGGFKIQRFRISGLFGEPLSKKSKSYTLEWINNIKAAKREVVILTNGVALQEQEVIDTLKDVDYVHISLDAATSETFDRIKLPHKKGKPTGVFDEIINGIKNLCHLVSLENKSAKVGIGFVVTQENAHEVEKAITLAEECNAKFIRFKPDIRGMNAIAWRNWREAEAKIRNRKVDGSLRVVITDPGWSHYRAPVVDTCWAQYLYSTIGADGCLYPCDHLTGANSQASLGELDNSPDCFKRLWKAALSNERLSVRHRECSLCPPFGWRVNRFIAQLHEIYSNHEWDDVRDWIKSLKISQHNCPSSTKIA